MTFNNETSLKVKQFGKDTNLFIRSRYHVIELGAYFSSGRVERVNSLFVNTIVKACQTFDDIQSIIFSRYPLIECSRGSCICNGKLFSWNLEISLKLVLFLNTFLEELIIWNFQMFVKKKLRLICWNFFNSI